MTVFVGNTNVGQFNLRGNGRGEFESDASSLPAITAGTVLTIKNGDATILSGTFSGGFPSASHSAKAKGLPTPRPARFFEARLRGGNVVPPVTTEARIFEGCA